MKRRLTSRYAPQCRHRTGLPRADESGMSLIEMMIAMTLGLMLVSGMIAVFAGNKRSSDLNTAMADIQENARFALDLLSREIRMAGFQGCQDLNHVSANLIGDDLPTDNMQNTATMGSLIGNGGMWAPAPPQGFMPANHDAIAGTHALTLQFGSPATWPLTQPVSTGGVPDTVGAVVVDTTPGISSEEFSFSVGDYGMIADCNGADIFRITSVGQGANTATIGHDASRNRSGAFTRLYAGGAGEPTRFMRFVSNVYYVGDTGETNDEGDAVRALYLQSLPYGDMANNPPTEIVRGVEDMRLSFGIRTGSQSLTYVTADDAQYDPGRIESIRIGLLLSSFDRIADEDDTNSYVLAGQLIEPDTAAAAKAAGTYDSDQRFRLAFNTTVKVRNRRTRP